MTADRLFVGAGAPRAGSSLGTVSVSEASFQDSFLTRNVVGPAVNEVGRLAALCRSVDQSILISSTFAASVVEDRRRFASLGRFSLREVGDPQELYTLDTRG